MRLVFFALPSIGYSTYLAAWLWMKVWQPQSTAGWWGMAALWLVSAMIVVVIHFFVADIFIPDGEQSELGSDGLGHLDRES